MAVTAPIANGRPDRKQLSAQLDRLDSIIDALAEGLPEAVAAAAREGTHLAVKAAIVEIISNPELRGLFQPPTAVPGTPVAMPIEVAPSTSARLWSRLKSKLASARVAITERFHTTSEAISTTTKTLAAIMPLRRMVLVALGTGVAVATIGYAAPVGFAAILAGIGGVVTAAVAQVGSWFRRSTRMLMA
ncbi:MAG TPA: hypothetical protein VGL71_12600 [Urbifossiella sp.]